MKTYLCYIEGRGKIWEGVCVDFDISVFGHTLEGAKAVLEEAVLSYVSDAERESEPARSRLLRRRSPWLVRLSWRMKVLLSHLSIDQDKPSFQARFMVPCHV